MREHIGKDCDAKSVDSCTSVAVPPSAPVLLMARPSTRKIVNSIFYFISNRIRVRSSSKYVFTFLFIKKDMSF